jgi:hypothetical protein
LPAYTSDTIALGIIAKGRELSIADKGIIIALATGLVESNLTMYANEGDPESLDYPHDAVSTDANSVGVFQQRAPWWGTCACRMDVKCSAGMFFDALRKVDPSYSSDEHTPGWYAQQVQRSAYPDRYDKRMPEAVKLFDRLRAVPTAPPPGAVTAPKPVVPPPQFKELDYMTGGGASSRSRPPINWFIHTEEGNSSAEQLARFCNGDNDVSYHYTVRDGIVCDVVDTDLYSWSVLDANVFSINGCFAGSRAGWSRDEWMRRERDLEIMAFLAVQDCRKYGFSTLVIAPPYHKDAGISDHKYVTECLRIGTHVDVGDNYPWDVFSGYVDKYTARDQRPQPPAQSAPPPPASLVPATMDAQVREIWDQLRGPTGQGWEQLGGRSLVDAVAELLKDAEQ